MLTGLSVYPQKLPDGAKGKLSRLRTDRHDSVSHKLWLSQLRNMSNTAMQCNGEGEPDKSLTRRNSKTRENRSARVSFILKGNITCSSQQQTNCLYASGNGWISQKLVSYWWSWFIFACWAIPRNKIHDLPWQARPIVGIFLKIFGRQKAIFLVALTCLLNLLENPWILFTRREGWDYSRLRFGVHLLIVSSRSLYCLSRCEISISDSKAGPGFDLRFSTDTCTSIGGGTST